MRIDKYLWCTRYFKTRSIASNAVKKGHVRVNGSAVKPSRDVFPMDKIVVRKNQIDYQLTVLDVPESRVGAKLVDIYRKDTTPKDAFEHSELLQHAKSITEKKDLVDLPKKTVGIWTTFWTNRNKPFSYL